MNTMILASGSPRRKELMTLLPWAFEVKVKEVDEQLLDDLTVKENVQALALKKALAIAKDYPDQIVIGADTMVCMGEQLLGKPRDKEDAFRMLTQLSGKQHQVLSGVAVVCMHQEIKHTFVEETQVKMQVLEEKEIMDYINTGEPMDKAGSYGIQGIGARYIEGIEGDYFNVVGLPIHHLYQFLQTLIK